MQNANILMDKLTEAVCMDISEALLSIDNSASLISIHTASVNLSIKMFAFCIF